jgi:hypothetical protein
VRAKLWRNSSSQPADGQPFTALVRRARVKVEFLGQPIAAESVASGGASLSVGSAGQAADFTNQKMDEALKDWRLAR